jgi:predicted transcriptional regulator
VSSSDRIPGENERRCPCCPSIYPVGSDQWGILRQRVNGKQVACKRCCAARNHPYNGEVGSKGGGASWDAAEQMKTKAGRLRVQCLDMIAQHGPLGADRLAFLMDADEDVVSPRLSELVALGVLKKGARTAITKRGNRAHVYQLSGKEEEAA